jgi:hypothetical protein
MKTRLAFVLFAIAISFGNLCTQQAALITREKAGWRNIGESAIDLAANSYEMILLPSDEIASVKVKVLHAGLILTNLEFFYENGIKEDVKINMSIPDLHESNAIDLKKSEGKLKKIVFHYLTLPNDKKFAKAYVEIWGLKKQYG